VSRHSWVLLWKDNVPQLFWSWTFLLCERLTLVNAMHCRVSNVIDLFNQTYLLFWFKQFMMLEILTVDFDVAFAWCSSHIIGGLDLILSSHSSWSAIDSQAVKSIGIPIDFHSGIFGDVTSSLKPCNGRRGCAVYLAFQDNLFALIGLLVS